MTELKDLQVGDEVTLTIKAKVSIRGEEDGEEYAYFDFADYGEYVLAYEKQVESGVVEIDRAPRPLPTNDGRYISRSNVDDIQGAQIHTLDGGVWYQFTGESVIKDSLDTLFGTRYAHENLGGLVRLVPEQ